MIILLKDRGLIGINLGVRPSDSVQWPLVGSKEVFGGLVVDRRGLLCIPREIVVHVGLLICNL